MASKVSVIEISKKYLKDKQNFVLQGGAGSGKTETLKELLQYLLYEFPNKKVICITHTNLAVEEIKSRIGDIHYISTIHSFLYNIIKNYKKNIFEVIDELFTLRLMKREEFNRNVMEEKEYKKIEHEKYKKVYEKYREKLYSMKKESIEKCTNKIIYDKKPESYNEIINEKIKQLNEEIRENIKNRNYHDIDYNNTKFNSFSELTFGHDGLIEITVLLFKKYPVMEKIFKDKIDYIFIDEYQDTRREIIEIFLKFSDIKNSPVVCLFGDTMQSIYEEGIGNVQEYMDSGVLKLVIKEDNFRCSEQVIEFINPLRLDKLNQNVEYKNKANGILEDITDRQGKVEVFYSLCENKPTIRSEKIDKDNYLKKIDKMLEVILEDQKVLLLTNKAIANKLNFGNLYEIFNERYSQAANEKIEIQLNTIQLTELCEVCYDYKEKNYNQLLIKLKKNGFRIRNISDKEKLSKNIKEFLIKDLSLIEALETAYNLGYLKKTDSYKQNIENKERFLVDLESNLKYKEFKNYYTEGNNTYLRIVEKLPDLIEEEFEELESFYKKEVYYRKLFSKDMKFSEVLNYFYFINEKSQYITMHKTKGSGISSVIIVMEEYFWNTYDFSLLYLNKKELNDTTLMKKIRSQKLIYVACSRAIENLTCIKMITQDEEKQFLKYFPMAQKLEI